MLARVVWPALGVPGGITCSFHALGALSPTKHLSRVLITQDLELVLITAESPVYLSPWSWNSATDH